MKTIKLNMNNLVSKKDQQGQCCIIHCRHDIATKIYCFTESTWGVVLKAADIRGDGLLCKGVLFYVLM